MIPKIAAQDGWLVIMANGDGAKGAGHYTLLVKNLEVTESAMELIEKMDTTLKPGPNPSIEEEDGEYVLKYFGSHHHVLHPSLADFQTDLPPSILHYVLRKRVVADDKVQVPIEVVSQIAELHSLMFNQALGDN